MKKRTALIPPVDLNFLSGPEKAEIAGRFQEYLDTLSPEEVERIRESLDPDLQEHLSVQVKTGGIHIQVQAE